ncbi:MAG TPA: asparagine synthase (glutamine-hydrolyzing), partial [Verrucomicrobiae bacterium]|nr:asparagine synthase (glutamine-hydrolyzing) [Verrucomicrobiae bacterium]
MCGIAVNFNFHNNATPLNLARLRHRGPDGQGEWRSPDGRAWLGHTRLAILDLSPAGAQPMLDDETGNVIVFNGEIYNHLALRRDLGARQSVWRGSSDTETLLAAYRIWGEKMVERLKGMFAFAIYDGRRHGLFLARDRLGIKPLYYHLNHDGFYAASEIRVLPLRHETSIHADRVAMYLQWGACPEEGLIFPEIKVFPAGHSMFISSKGKIESPRYWPPPGPLRATARDPARQVRQLLETAVEEHLLADVPVASFLSGGIDSSIITALAARKSQRQLLTFSIGFKQAAHDETGIAREVASRYQTAHHRIELDDEETLQIISEAVEKFDLPSVDALNTYIIAKKVAGQGIKVALSGLGSDELFGGYPSFRDVPRLKWLSRLPSFCRNSLGRLGTRGRRLSDLPACDDASQLALWRRRFWTDAMLDNANLPAPALDCGEIPDLPDDFARISWMELTRYMRQTLLRDSDQMSMAVSLELRVPFLDHKLVEFALGLPASAKS